MTKYMPLNLWKFFCTPAVVHTSCFDECNYMKVKSPKYVGNVDQMVPNTKKNYCKLQFILESKFN